MYATALPTCPAVRDHLNEFETAGFAPPPPPRSSAFVRRAVAEQYLERAVESWPLHGVTPPYNMCHGYGVRGVPCYFCGPPVGVHVADEVYNRVRRVAGWLRHAPEYPLLWKVIGRGLSRRGMGSSATLLNPVMVAQAFPSPGHCERWLRDVRRVANRILSGWQIRVSLASLASACDSAWIVRGSASNCDQPWRPLGARNAGRQAAVDTLQRVFGYPDGWHAGWKWHETLAAMRSTCPVRPGDHSVIGPLRRELREELDRRFGRQHDDDTASLWQARLVAMCHDGAVIAAGQITGGYHGDGLHCQVVVTDPATGLRCHLGVPPQFGRPLGRGETASQRVRAAVAWTFQMSGRDYRPDKET